MSWRKGKTSGWTAFDRAQRHKEDGKLEVKTENFPSVSNSGRQISNILGSTSSRIGVLEKPFASVLHGHANNLGSENHYDMDESTLQAGIPIKSEYVSGQCVADDGLHCEDGPNFIKHVPIEPEWEEDDVYVVHRKDALRIMRSASHHSKAASDAYLRGDHVSAQLHSRKAREEWIITKRLNAKAAMEILAIRNSENDEWTLDLHGLHASEAVQALGAHLQKIESHIPVKRIMYTSRVNVMQDYLLSVPPESASSSSSDKLSYQNPFIGSRPTSLQVITGKGTHSRGKASIPAAIKRFLTENGYRYDESRPGVIDVKPKFRQPTKD